MPEHAVLVQGDPEQTSVRRVQAKAISAAVLLEKLEPLRSIGQVYLLGRMKAHGIAEQLPTVAVSGETVTLNYADPGILADLGKNQLHEVEMFVQVRHTPGTFVPELQISGDVEPAISTANTALDSVRKWQDFS